MKRPVVGPELGPYAYVLVGVMLAGLSPVLTKLLLLQNLTVETVVAARYLVAVLFLLPVALPCRPLAEGPPPDRRAWAALVLVGIFGSGLGALLFTAAVDLASAGVANAISKTAPIFVALFAYFILCEPVTYLCLLLVVVMLAADLLIVAGELTFSGQLASARLLGDALALLAGMSRAAAEILGRSSLHRFAPNTVALARFGIGLLVATAVTAGTGGWSSLASLGSEGWLILLGLGAISTSLSMSLYYRGLAAIPAHVAVSLRLAGVIVTVVLSWLMLGETLTPYHIAGIGVLISGAYLLVMRSTHPAPQPQVRWTGLRPWTRLRPRFIVLVLLLMVGSVAVVWYLSIRHSTLLLQEQLRMTIGEIGAIVADYGDIEQRPSWQSYQRYLERVIGHRIQGEMYLLEVVYAAVLDERGNLGAFAMSDRLRLRDEQGRRITPGDRVAQRQFLEAMDRGDARRYGLVTATVHRLRGGEVVRTVKMGCTRQLQAGMVGDMIGRSAVAALTVLLLVVALVVLSAGNLIEPVERLAAEISRVHGGSEVGKATDEVGEIRYGVAKLIEQLRRERQVLSQLRDSLATLIFEYYRKVEEGAGERIALALDVRPLLSDDRAAGLEAAVEVLAREVALHGGYLRLRPGGILGATWGDDGAERDDVLRAALAALAVAERLGRLLGDGGLIIGVAAGDSAREALDRAMALWPVAGPGEAGVRVALAADLVQEVADHVAMRRIDGVEEAYLISGPVQGARETGAREVGEYS